MPGARWNSNLHAFDRLLDTVPAGAGPGLDVGCGEGETTRRLRARTSSAVGLDTDESCIARAHGAGDDIDFMVGDLFTADLPEQGFDVVSAVAVLHHMDHAAGLARLSSLVRPGGRLLVVGLAKSSSAKDYARDAFDTLAVRRHTLTKSIWKSSAPQVWPPPLSYSQVRSTSRDVLPDAQFHRLPYLRYGLTWSRASI